MIVTRFSRVVMLAKIILYLDYSARARAQYREKKVGPGMKKVVIIGGGASGMAAALTAAEEKENSVILLERQSRVGRKLLATGNGRCNLTNTGAAVKNYHGQNPAFALPSLQAFPPESPISSACSTGISITG